jgi:hypothetical protein
VGASSWQIILPQLHSHTSGDLHGGISELMAMCACRSLRSTTWSSRRSLDLANSVLGVSLVFVVIQCGAEGRGEVDAQERGCWFRGGGSVIFPDFIDRMRRILVQDSTRTSPSRLTITTCASLLAAGQFIESQNLVDDGASLNLAMVDARLLFQRPSRRRWNLAATVSFGECKKP